MMPKDGHRQVLYQSTAFEIVTIKWDQLRTANPHHHDWSHCLVLVQKGQIENTLDDGFHLETAVYGPGEVFSNPLGAQHSTRCLSEEAVTLHVYTPRLVNPPPPEVTESQLNSLLALNNQVSENSLANFSQLLEQLESYIKQTHFSPDLSLQPTWYGHTASSLLVENFSKNITSSLRPGSNFASVIEEEVSKIFCHRLQWEKSTCTSVSVAQQLQGHLLALHCARQYHRLSFQDQSRAIIYLSAEVSNHFIAAAKLVGYETSNLAIVPSELSGKINVSAFEQLIKKHREQGAYPFFVCGQMGSKKLGNFDHFSQIKKICFSERLWFHVDACNATAALFSKKMAPLLCGIGDVDSILFDTQCRFPQGHHGGSALYLCAHQFAHEMIVTRELQQSHSLNFWALCKTIGINGLGAFVDRQLGLRDELLAWIATQPRLELVSTPDYLDLALKVLSINSGLTEKRLLHFSLMQTYLTFNHVTQMLERALYR